MGKSGEELPFFIFLYDPGEELPPKNRRDQDGNDEKGTEGDGIERGTD